MTARRVRPIFSRLFKKVPEGSLHQLMAAITDGRSFDGKRNDTCIYGNLAKGDGYDFFGKTPEEISTALREFGEKIGFPIRADGHLDEVERFCAQSGRGDNFLTSPPLAHIHDWLNFAMMERGIKPLPQGMKPNLVLEDVIALAGETVAI